MSYDPNAVERVKSIIIAFEIRTKALYGTDAKIILEDVAKTVEAFEGQVLDMTTLEILSNAADVSVQMLKLSRGV